MSIAGVHECLLFPGLYSIIGHSNHNIACAICGLFALATKFYFSLIGCSLCLEISQDDIRVVQSAMHVLCWLQQWTWHQSCPVSHARPLFLGFKNGHAIPGKSIDAPPASANALLCWLHWLVLFLHANTPLKDLPFCLVSREASLVFSGESKGGADVSPRHTGWRAEP